MNQPTKNLAQQCADWVATNTLITKENLLCEAANPRFCKLVVADWDDEFSGKGTPLKKLFQSKDASKVFEKHLDKGRSAFIWGMVDKRTGGSVVYRDIQNGEAEFGLNSKLQVDAWTSSSDELNALCELGTCTVSLDANKGQISFSNGPKFNIYRIDRNVVAYYMRSKFENHYLSDDVLQYGIIDYICKQLVDIDEWSDMMPSFYRHFGDFYEALFPALNRRLLDQAEEEDEPDDDDDEDDSEEEDEDEVVSLAIGDVVHIIPNKQCDPAKFKGKFYVTGIVANQGKKQIEYIINTVHAYNIDLLVLLHRATTQTLADARSKEIRVEG